MTMIIKGERVTASRAAAPLLRHLLHGEENDRVTVVQGTEQDARAAFADARVADKKFALRHFIISPENETTRADAMMVLGLLAKDFAFDPATAIVFEHDKPRALASAFGTHWHCLVPEIIDAATGRVMDSRYSYLRHEKVARIAEHRLKHKFVRSNHEKACLAALESDGCLDVADALRAFIASDPGEAHREAFSRGVHQMGKRQSVDIPAARAAIRAAWETTTGWGDFTRALAADGYRISTGDRDGTLVIETQKGVFVGAAHRLARVRKIDVQRRKDHSNEHSNDAKQALLDLRPTAPAEGRPGGGNPVVSVDRVSELPDQLGGASPSGGRGGSIHTGRLAAAFRIALTRNSAAVHQLLDRARQLARSPQERVRAGLEEREKRVKAELENFNSISVPLPALDEARARVTRARSECDKFKGLLQKANAKRADWLARRPSGVMASVSGRTREWATRLAKIDANIAALTGEEGAAWQRHSDGVAIVADFEKELVRKKHAFANLPERQDRLFLLRRELARISVAKQMLEKDPVIALGGLAMVLAAAAVAIIAEGLFSQRPAMRSP